MSHHIYYYGRLAIENLSRSNNDQVRSLFSLRKSFSKPKMENGNHEQICSSVGSKAVKTYGEVGRGGKGNPQLQKWLQEAWDLYLEKIGLFYSQLIPDLGKQQSRQFCSLSVFPTRSLPTVWIVGSPARSRRGLEAGYSGAWLRE